jgi:predicted nucleic acid-binding protein
MIVVDSSVLIDHLRGSREAKDAIDRAPSEAGQRPAASVVTKVEILQGMRSYGRRATYELFSLITWIPIDDKTAELAGGFARAYRRSHNGVGIPDYIVAATAARRRARLWTLNAKHFPMFADLESPY